MFVVMEEIIERILSHPLLVVCLSLLCLLLLFFNFERIAQAGYIRICGWCPFHRIPAFFSGRLSIAHH